MNLKYKVLLLTITALALSCKEKPAKQIIDNPQKEIVAHQETHKPEPKEVYTDFEKSLMEMGLQDIRQLDSTIKIELKYATADNFTGVVLYTELHHAFLQAEAAAKLVEAQKQLKARDSSLGLLVYDAARPNSTQYKMWDLVVNTPKQRYVAAPGNGSLHNFGGAVDLTIIKNGVPLDMGTPYDFFGKKAQPRYNAFFLEKKELSPQQVTNRELLRAVMKAAGFTPINSEWWHFNAFSLSYAKKHYKIIK